MANTRGVFTLQDVRYAQEDDVWVTPEQAFASNITAPPNVGYFGSGYSPSYFSIVDRTNFTSDTTARVPGADLSRDKVGCSGSSNSQAGYFSGGSVPPNNTITDVDKITYSTETSSRAPGSNISFSAGDAAGANSSSNSYFAGGNYAPGGVPTYSNVDKMSFATEQYFRVPSANLTLARRQIHGFSGTDEMYVAGGYDGSWRSTTDKLTFATDTTARIPGADLSQPVSTAAAASNGTIGYVANGAAAPNNSRSFVDKITFATSTRSTLPTNMPVARNSSAGTGNSSDAYFAGGNFSPGGATVYSSIFKIDYSTDSISTAGGNLSQARRSLSATGPRTNELPQTKVFVASTQNLKGESTSDAGYYSGGFESAHVSSTDKTFYSSDTTGRVPFANMPVDSGGCAPISSNDNGYYSGGYDQPTTQSSLKKLSYTTETQSLVPGGVLSASKYAMGAAETRTRGYVVGGSAVPISNYSTVERMDFAVETFSILPGSTLSANRRYPQGSSGPDFGYFTGGYEGGPVSTVDKLSFASETAFRSPSTFPSVRSATAAISDGVNASYIGGGYPAPNTISTISKLSYATDSTGDLPAVLSSARYQLGTTGNSTQGYFAGGSPVPVSNQSRVDKFNFASDTCVQVPGAALSAPRRVVQGTSSQKNSLPRPRAATSTLNQSLSTSGIPNFGYIAGGSGPGSTSPLSSIGKYNFDTDTRLPFTGQLSIARYIGASGSSSTAGYVAMGLSYVAPTYTRHSRVDKLTFATENVAPVPGANTVVSLQNSCGASSSLAAYFSGGAPGPVSTTQKMTFSAETTAAVPGAALSGNRDSPRAGASSSAMYMCGGTPSLTTVDKLVFSTDTTNVTPSAALNGTRYVGAMTGNATQGYYGGGLRQPGTVGLSDINKINYSTDTTQLIGASLSRSNWNVGATGNATKGYFAGGVPGPVSTVDKLDYVTETTSVIQSLSGTRYGVIGVSGRCNAGAYTSNVL